MNIYRILHAGYIFEDGGVRIAMDPIFENPFSGNCYAFPAVQFDIAALAQQNFDAVFLSHYHEDHCSLESLNHLKRSTPIYLYCRYSELFDWLAQLGFTEVHGLALNVSVAIGPMTVTPRRALDADIDSILQIECDGLKVLNVGDAWIDDQTLAQLADLAPWDLLLWPFQTMREIEVLDPRRSDKANGEIPPEWPPQLQKLNPRYLVPSACQFRHEPWSWYQREFFPISYCSFEKQLRTVLPQIRLVRLNPGQGFWLDEAGVTPLERLPWLAPIGDQDVDFGYDPVATAPTTEDVAKNFGRLTDTQRARVADYIQTELGPKLESLEAPQGDFFAGPWRWCLRIWDANGEMMSTQFQVQGAKVSPVTPTENFDWLTEIPAATLFGILENGQSLSASYIRVNDCIYSPEHEQQIAATDVLEDPLIRALFTVPFGAYQRAQLQRIQSI